MKCSRCILSLVCVCACLCVCECMCVSLSYIWHLWQLSPESVSKENRCSKNKNKSGKQKVRQETNKKLKE